jgi:hypothetical protein
MRGNLVLNYRQDAAPITLSFLLLGGSGRGGSGFHRQAGGGGQFALLLVKSQKLLGG